MLLIEANYLEPVSMVVGMLVVIDGLIHIIQIKHLQVINFVIVNVLIDEVFM
jgi:hypothetical protein